MTLRATARRLGAFAMLAGVLSACEPAGPELPTLVTTTTTLLPVRVLTGEAIAIDTSTIMFVEPGRSISIVLVDGVTLFEGGTLPDVASMAAANLQGLPVAATVRGVDIGSGGGSDRTLAQTISASPVPPAVPFEAEGPGRIQVIDPQLGYFRFVPSLRWGWHVTAWTVFDSSGDFMSFAAMQAAEQAGAELWLEGEGAVIGQQLTLMRRVRAWRGN